MVEKNQFLAQQAASKLQKQEEMMEQMRKEKDIRYTTLLQSLQNENLLLKEETNVNFKSNKIKFLEKDENEKNKFFSNLRAQLVEEIERLEKIQRMRDEEAQLEIANVKIEHENLKNQNTQLQEAQKEENKDWQVKLQEESTLSEKIQNALKFEIAELSSQNKALQKMLNASCEELRMLKGQFEDEVRGTSQEANAIESKFRTENVHLSTELERNRDINNQKIGIKDQLIDSLKIQNQQIMGNYEKRMKVIIAEKKATEIQLRSLVHTTSN